jgi:hypothetical protein
LIVVLLAVVWLFVPMSLLSWLSAPSPLMFIYPPLLARVFAHPGSVAMYYLMTGLLVAGAGGLGVAAIVWPFLLPLAAPIGCIALLIHARLLGRLAYVAVYRSGPKAGRRKKRSKRKRAAEQIQAEEGQPANKEIQESFRDLSKRPAEPGPVPVSSTPAEDEEEDEWAVKKKPYAVTADDPWKDADPELKPVPLDGFRPIEEAPAEELPPGVDPRRLSRLEEKMVKSGKLAPPPRWLFINGLFSFLLHPKTARCWLGLSMLGLVLGLLLHALMRFWPTV